MQDWDERKTTTRKALEFLEKAQENPESYKRESFVVYGDGGSNRWFVRPDGSVQFSEGHSVEESDVRKAQDLGFDVL